MSAKEQQRSAQKPGHQANKPGPQVAVDDAARTEWKSLVANVLVPAKFTNTLPEIPFDPKFLNRPLSSLRRHVQYAITSLDHSYKIPVLSEPDMGVCPNLVDPELYRVPDTMEAPPALAEPDEILVEQAEAGNTVQGERVYRTQKEQTWMRRSEYMANEAYQANPIAQYRSRADTMLSYRNKIEAGDEYKTTEQKIADIEASFECPNLADLKHPTKPGLKAVKITPLVPSQTDVWSNLYTQLVFDDCPFEIYGKTEEEGLTAMIKPFRENTKSAARDNRQAQQLLGYLLPKEQEETDVRHDEEHGQLHQWMRNHAYTMEPYEKVFVFTDLSEGNMRYNIIDAKLTVHSHTSRAYMSDRVHVKRRGFKSAELEPRRKRQRGLMTAAEIEKVAEDDQDLAKAEQEEEERAAAASVEELLASDEKSEEDDDDDAPEVDDASSDLKVPPREEAAEDDAMSQNPTPESPKDDANE